MDERSGGEPAPQALGQDLLELRERPGRRLLDLCHRAAGRQSGARRPRRSPRRHREAAAGATRPRRACTRRRSRRWSGRDSPGSGANRRRAAASGRSPRAARRGPRRPRTLALAGETGGVRAAPTSGACWTHCHTSRTDPVRNVCQDASHGLRSRRRLVRSAAARVECARPNTPSGAAAAGGPTRSAAWRSPCRSSRHSRATPSRRTWSSGALACSSRSGAAPAAPPRSRA